MIIYHVVDFFTVVVEALMMFILCETFCKRRENIASWVYNLSIFIPILLIGISNHIFNYGVFNVAGMLFAFFVLTCLYRAKISTKFIIILVNYLLSAITEIVTMYSIIMIYGITAEEAIEVTSYRLLGSIVSKMLFFLSVNTIRLKYRKNSFNMHTSYWILFFLMLTISVATVFLIFNLSFNIENTYMYNLSVICSIGLFFSTFFALYLYENLAKQTDIIRKQRRYEYHLKEQIKHLDEILITQNQVKKFKHDFSNYVIGLEAYFKTEDYIGAKEYVKKLEKDFVYDRSIETGNIALDAILSTKKVIAESKNIKFIAKIQVPKKLFIDPIDMCIIFGNALDNAIEACERIESENKEISLVLICQGDRVFCRIINSAPGIPKLLKFKTLKPDKENHGIGLENIKTALEKYDSNPSIEYLDNKFILKFVIFQKEELVK